MLLFGIMEENNPGVLMLDWLVEKNLEVKTELGDMLSVSTFFLYPAFSRQQRIQHFLEIQWDSVQFSSIIQPCLTLCDGIVLNQVHWEPNLARDKLPCLGSLSVFQHIRHTEGPPLAGVLLLFCASGAWWASPSIAQLLTLVWRERAATVMAPPPVRDSAASTCFHGCLAFLHRFCPPQSPPSCPLALSLHSQQQPLPWDCSTIPMCQLPAVVTSRGPASLSRLCMAAARTVWFSFYLGCYRSAALFSASNVSPLTQTVAPMWGPLLQFPHPLRTGPVLLTLLFFPLPSFAWF